MNKNELITAMAEASGLPKKDCETALNAFTGVVENALKAEDKVQRSGLALLRSRPALPGLAGIPERRNPLKSLLQRPRFSKRAKH